MAGPEARRFPALISVAVFNWKQRELRIGGLPLCGAHVVKDGPAAEGRRDVSLVLQCGGEAGEGIALLLDGAGETVEAAKASTFSVSPSRAASSERRRTPSDSS